jgi:tetratricopeptide (TPR) repeat protein
LSRARSSIPPTGTIVAGAVAHSPPEGDVVASTALNGSQTDTVVAGQGDGFERGQQPSIDTVVARPQDVPAEEQAASPRHRTVPLTPAPPRTARTGETPRPPTVLADIEPPTRTVSAAADAPAPPFVVAALPDKKGVGGGDGGGIDDDEALETQQFAAALNLDADQPALWHQLELGLSDISAVTVGDATYDRKGCFVEALSRDPALEGAWYDLAMLLRTPAALTRKPTLRRSSKAAAAVAALEEPDADVVVIGGQRHTKRDCAAKALTADASDAALWMTLGGLLPGKATAQVGATQMSAAQCFERALKIDDGISVVWANLAASLGATAKATVGGVAVDRKYCSVRALNNTAGMDDFEITATWAYLGGALLPEETANVHDKEVTKLAAWVRAVAGDASSATAWSNLARCLPAGGAAKVGLDTYSRDMCFAMAVECEPAIAAGWNNLGISMPSHNATAHVKQGEYSKAMCFVEALVRDPQLAIAWCNLGHCVDTDTEAVVNGLVYDRRACFTQALGFDPTLASAWLQAGATLSERTVGDVETVSVGAEAYTRVDCLTNAARFNPRVPNAWLQLARALSVDDNVVIRNEPFGRRECCLKALALDQRSPSAWTHLGTALHPGERVAVGGADYTAVDCHVAALHRKPRFGVAWLHLAAALAGGLTATVQDVEMTTENCLLEALDCEGAHKAQAWTQMGLCLRPDRTLSVRGAQCDSRDCFIEAVKVDPADEALVANLRAFLPPGQRVTVHDRVITSSATGIQDADGAAGWLSRGAMMEGLESRIECYEEAIKADPKCAEAWMRYGLAMATEEDDEEDENVAQRNISVVPASRRRRRAPSRCGDRAGRPVVPRGTSTPSVPRPMLPPTPTQWSRCRRRGTSWRATMWRCCCGCAASRPRHKPSASGAACSTGRAPPSRARTRSSRPPSHRGGRHGVLRAASSPRATE